MRAVGRVATCVVLQLAGLVLLSAGAESLQAQGPTEPGAQNASPSRAALEAAAATAEHAATSGPAAQREAKTREAAAIRERLKEGDIHVGDRIDLVVQGNKDFTQSFTVRDGRMLEVPNLPPIPLAGVLHSELQPYLTTQLARYLRDPQVEARSLMRIAVLGQVMRPGFFAIPSDALVSDAIMTAGGPTQTAEISQTLVRRGGQVLYEKDVLHQAVGDGATLDRLNLRAGDEIVVGEKSHKSLGTILGYTASAVGIVAGIILIANR